jgi:signal transduction histidine kinase
MDELVTDALNYNRAVREELVLQPVDTSTLLRGIIETYPQFQPPRAEVRLVGALPRVLANQGALAQCFSELLDNAVKFVEKGAVPQVRVWAEMRSGHESGRSASQTVRFWFEDNGTGIPPNGQERIFQMFQRMHGPEYSGTGIGLALVRKLVERMHGRVGVESAQGKGSRFWIDLVGLTT